MAEDLSAGMKSRSAYPPIFSVIADIAGPQGSAKSGREQSQQKHLFDELAAREGG
jgi:hypothetical protein